MWPTIRTRSLIDISRDASVGFRYAVESVVYSPLEPLYIVIIPDAHPGHQAKIAGFCNDHDCPLQWKRTGMVGATYELTLHVACSVVAKAVPSQAILFPGSTAHRTGHSTYVFAVKLRVGAIGLDTPFALCTWRTGSFICSHRLIAVDGGRVIPDSNGKPLALISGFSQSTDSTRLINGPNGKPSI